MLTELVPNVVVTVLPVLQPLSVKYVPMDSK